MWFHLRIWPKSVDYGFDVKNMTEDQLDDCLDGLNDFAENNHLEQYGDLDIHITLTGLGVDVDLNPGEDISVLRGYFKNFFEARGYEVNNETV